MELFDLYDVNRNKLGGTWEREQRAPKGCYRLVAHIIVFNKKGEMLVQLRAKDKHLFPDVWDLSAGGSIIAGETSSQGAKRELFEELGIKYDIENMQPNFSISFTDGFNDFYLIDYDTDASKLHVQKEEVQRAEWMSKEEVLNNIDNGKFVPYRKSLIELIFDFYDNRRGTHQK